MFFQILYPIDIYNIVLFSTYYEFSYRSQSSNNQNVIYTSDTSGKMGVLDVSDITGKM